MRHASARLLRFAALAALGAALVSQTSLNFLDFDIWHQMALAREIVSTGRIPQADVFAYTPTLNPVVHHEWGAGMIAYALSMWFGPHWVMPFKYLLMFAIAALCLACATRRGGPVETWGFLALPAVLPLATGFIPIRAQAYSFLFLAVLFYCFLRDEAGSRRWILPWLAAFPLWVNLHAGCVLAICFTAAYWLEHVLRRKPHRHLLVACAAMALMLSLNLYGPRYYGYLWHALTMPRPQIDEWTPVTTAPPLIMAGFFLSAAILAYGWASARFRLLPGISIVLAACAAAGLHCKMLPVYGIAWLCWVPGYVRPTALGDALALRQWRELSIACWLILFAFFARIGIGNRFWELRVPGSVARAGAFGRAYPAGAVDYLAAAGFRGNVMTPFVYGAYVSWKLYPQVRIGMDSRYEASYPGWLFQQVNDFYAARPGWRETLAAYPTDVVLAPVREPVAAAMATSGWPRVYSDGEFVIYARPGLALPAVRRAGPIPDAPFP